MKNFRQCLFAFALLAFFSCSKDDCEKKAWKDDCVCTMDYNPVCGCDGETYSNACHAECHGIKKYTPGECK